MKRLLLIFVFLFSAPIYGQSTVSTEVSAHGLVSYNASEKHPTKMDWSSMTFCGGRNAKSKNGQFLTNEGSRTTNEDEWTLFTPVEGPIKSIFNQSLRWSSGFNEKDYVFHIEFNKIVGKDVHIRKERVCNTKSWDYHIDEATSKVKTSLTLVVPPQVWVLRIGTRVNTNLAGISYSFDNVATIQKGPSHLRSENANRPMEFQTVDQAAASIYGEYAYFFVKPGDEIEIALEFIDKNTDIDLLADFEVTFVGSNRCEKAVDEFLGAEKDQGPQRFSDQRIQSAFDQVKNSLISGVNDIAALHRAMSFLGCMTSRDQISRLLYENNIIELKSILDTVNDFKRHSISQSSQSLVAIQLPALKVLTEMSRFSLGHSILSSMKPYCEDYPLFNDQGTVVGYKKGYIEFCLGLTKINQLLVEPDTGTTRTWQRDVWACEVREGAQGAISPYYESLLAEYKKIENLGLTCREIKRKRYQEINQFLSGYLANSKAKLLEEVMDKMWKLPPVSPHRDLVGLRQTIGDLYTLTLRLHDEVMEEMTCYSEDRNQKPSLESMKETLDQLKIVEAMYLDYHDRVVSTLGGGELSDAFRHSVGSIHVDHYQPSLHWLVKSYGGYLKDFVSSHQGAILEDNQMNNYEEILKCMDTPVQILEP